MPSRADTDRVTCERAVECANDARCRLAGRPRALRDCQSAPGLLCWRRLPSGSRGAQASRSGRVVQCRPLSASRRSPIRGWRRARRGPARRRRSKTASGRDRNEASGREVYSGGELNSQLELTLFFSERHLVRARAPASQPAPPPPDVRVIDIGRAPKNHSTPPPMKQVFMRGLMRTGAIGAAAAGRAQRRGRPSPVRLGPV